MKRCRQSYYLLVVFAALLVGCGLIPDSRRTPTPYGSYGQTFTDVVYCSPNGQPQKMDLYLPASGGPWPVFMYVHGGGWDKGDKAEGQGWKYLNDQGYLVASINYRLATYNIKFPDMIEDVKCAVRYLRANAGEYNLDPQHIGVLGASAGAHLAALLGVADESAGWDLGEYLDQSSRVQAVITSAVFSDLTQQFPNAMLTDMYLTFGEFPGTNSKGNIDASPVTYVSPDDPPFLILHGEKDGLSPVAQAQILNDDLVKAGVPTTLVLVKNGEHNLNSLNGQPPNPSPEEVRQDILRFLDRYLKR
jgi:acetyl esterase/lipase